MTSLLTLLLVSSCLLGAHGTLEVTSTSDVFQRSAEADERALEDDLIFKVTAVSKLYCASLCARDPACVTFTFLGDRTCQGHSVFVNSSTRFVAAPKAKTYQVEGHVQNVCGQQTGAQAQRVAVPGLARKMTVPCEGGWMVISRRQDGSVDFYRDWADYKEGFGNLEGEFWIGLELVHQLTKAAPWTLHIDLGDWEGNATWAEYSDFSLDSEAANYTLHATYLEGNINDSFAYHDGYSFTTRDRDNDFKTNDKNCATLFHGAWWFYKCGDANLFGDWKSSSDAPNKDGIRWKKWHGTQYSLKYVLMKMKMT